MADGNSMTRKYNSFSGVDIKATFGGIVIGELQAISVSITREKAPVYTMGSADPRAFARGKRGIAGTLIFIMFDRPALLNELSATNNFLSDNDDLRPGNFTRPNWAIQAQESEITTNNFADQTVANPWYTDQIPGFDIVLVAANEYGATAVMKILGVEILNEGYGVSIDDIVSEQQMTYVATGVEHWKYTDFSGTGSITGGATG